MEVGTRRSCSPKLDENARVMKFQRQSIGALAEAALPLRSRQHVIFGDCFSLFFYPNKPIPDRFFPQFVVEELALCSVELVNQFIGSI
jgi:hypothetical protein